MGTLSDITHNANNRHSQTLGHWQPLDKLLTKNSSSSTKMSGRARPRYMTPTLASKAQNNVGQPQSRPSTPASAGPSTEKGSWIVDAGRRLGISTPKSRREGRVPDGASIGKRLPDKATIFPKKPQVSFPSLGTINDSYPTANERREQRSTSTGNSCKP